MLISGAQSMNIFSRIQPFFLLSCLLLFANTAISQSDYHQTVRPVEIVVTIRPLHSLVSAITHGITEPVLLLDSTQSPHHTSLRPSDYRKLAQADIIFWAGASMETFLPAIINTAENKTRFVALMQADGVNLLSIRSKNARTGGTMETGSQVDPHFWLSTDNARHILKAVTRKLARLDSNNRDKYQKNLEHALKRIDALQADISEHFKLPSVSSTPFISYHDAYQYLEHDYGLNRLASVSLNEEVPPGIKQIRHIKALIRKNHIQCVFYEAPTQPPVLNTLLKGSQAKAIKLDILGIEKKAGKDLWFDSISTLAENMTDCLQTP